MEKVKRESMYAVKKLMVLPCSLGGSTLSRSRESGIKKMILYIPNVRIFSIISFNIDLLVGNLGGWYCFSSS